MVKPRAATTYLRPCTTEAGKISAETHLSHSSEESGGSTLEFFDSARLCWTLNNSKIFNRVKCSEKLGIAKMEINGKTIVISKGGRINVRKAENEEDALRTTLLVSKAAWPAMICSRCSRAISECIAGLCGRCGGKNCLLLHDGPPKPSSMSLRPSKVKTAGEILTEFEASQQSIFNDFKRNLDEAFQILSKAIVTPSPESSLADIEGSVAKKLEAAKLLAQDLIVQSQRQIDVSVGLTFMGIAINLESLNHAVCMLTKLVQSLSDPVLEQTWRIAVGGYGALWQKDVAKIRELARLHVWAKRQLSRGREGPERDLRKSLKGIAELGFHLSQIASIRLAV